MKKFSIGKLIIGVSVLFTSNLGWAVVCDNPTAQESTRIYFVNGMNNNAKAIEGSLEKLEELVGRSTSRSFGKSINNKENFLTQLLEVYKQKSGEASKYLEHIQDLPNAPQWFKNAFNQKLTLIANAAYYNDFD